MLESGVREKECTGVSRGVEEAVDGEQGSPTPLSYW